MPPFLSLTRPTIADARECVKYGQQRGFNYPRELAGRSDDDDASGGGSSSSAIIADVASSSSHKYSRRRWVEDRTRAEIGSGERTYARACAALKTWEHFDLGWASVDANTGHSVGDGVCVRARVGGVWMRNPLEIVRLRGAEGGARRRGVKKRFSFAHGTMEGHVLAGEERFAVELMDDGRVYYEAYAFSAPAHAVALIGYPLVRLLQKRFHWDSARVMRKIGASCATVEER